MTLSTEARKYMDMRDSLSDDELITIEAVFEEIYTDAELFGFPAAKDDRAAELEAALIKFIIDSREG